MSLYSSGILERLRGDGWIGVHDDIGDESFTYLDEGLPVRFLLQESSKFTKMSIHVQLTHQSYTYVFLN